VAKSESNGGSEKEFCRTVACSSERSLKVHWRTWSTKQAQGGRAPGDRRRSTGGHRPRVGGRPRSGGEPAAPAEGGSGNATVTSRRSRGAEPQGGSRRSERPRSDARERTSEVLARGEVLRGVGRRRGERSAAVRVHGVDEPPATEGRSRGHGWWRSTGNAMNPMVGSGRRRSRPGCGESRRGGEKPRGRNEIGGVATLDRRRA
jgi:hypothetical protein